MFLVTRQPRRFELLFLHLFDLLVNPVKFEPPAGGTEVFSVARGGDLLERLFVEYGEHRIARAVFFVDDAARGALNGNGDPSLVAHADAVERDSFFGGLARFGHRINRALHCDDVTVAAGRANVVALQHGRRRQHNIGELGVGIPVLLVDDDVFLLDMYTAKLKEEGFTVERALSGDAALQILHGGLQPDAIVFDMVLPGMDGEQLLKALHEEKSIRGAKLVALSNQSDTAVMEKSKDLGVDRYIVKASLVPSQVVAEVRKLLA